MNCNKDDFPLKIFQNHFKSFIGLLTNVPDNVTLVLVKHKTLLRSSGYKKYEGEDTSLHPGVY